MAKKPPTIIRAYSPLENLQKKYNTDTEALKARIVYLEARLAEFDPIIALKQLHAIEVENLNARIDELLKRVPEEKTINEIAEWK